jgi:hypothetical protein
MTVNAALRQQFEKRLEHGQLAETAIAKWLISRGCWVHPMYDIEIHNGKGPAFFGQNEALAAPDLLVKGISGAFPLFWAEVKHKTVFSWHRLTERWNTGIDSHHWKDYLRVSEISGFPLWLYFLHRSSEPDARDKPHCPEKCPTGLFGAPAKSLANPAPRFHENGSSRGMVYWPVERLQLLADLEELPGE